MVYVPDLTLGYRFPPDTTFIISNVAFTNVCKTNSYGLPGTDFDKQKPEGTYRILLIGNSDDSGFCSDGAYSYVMRLNDMFKKKGYPVEVINCATDNSQPIRNMEFVKVDGIQYNPDLVLMRNDQLPLVDWKMYRETYKGYALVATNLAHIEAFKKYFDQVFVNKIKNNFWFKLHDHSYIFRYMMKIYIDQRESSPISTTYVKLVNMIIRADDMRDLRLYVRKHIYYIADQIDVKEYDICIYNSQTNWQEELVTWETSPYAYKRIQAFSSGTQENTWIEIDLTDYLKEEIANEASFTSLMFTINPSTMRSFVFRSKGSQYGGEDVSPRLCIFENKDIPASESVLIPVDDGYVRGGAYENDNYELTDSLIQVRNGGEDVWESRKGLLKFDISNIQSVDKAILKLYVTKLEFGIKEDFGAGTDYNLDRRYTLSESADTFQNFQTFLEGKNIRFYLYNVYDHESSISIEKSFAHRQIGYLPLNIPYKEEYTFGKLDGHSTQLGHQVIAEAFFDALVNRIIPDSVLRKTTTKPCIPSANPVF
jgi:hypothetical protein